MSVGRYACISVMRRDRWFNRLKKKTSIRFRQVSCVLQFPCIHKLFGHPSIHTYLGNGFNPLHHLRAKQSLSSHLHSIPTYHSLPSMHPQYMPTINTALTMIINTNSSTASVLYLRYNHNSWSSFV